MATIKEDYVSFETAKLLKENGFNGECVAYYSIYKDNNASLHRWRNRQNYVNVKNDGYTIVPTLQMAMKWLREVHKLHVDSSIYTDTDGDSEHEYTYTYWDWLIFNSESGRRIAEPQIGCGRYDSYEQACEAAIKYCLEHLI